MKLIPRVLLAFLIMVRAASAQETMNWDQCVNTAVLNNPDLTASRESARSYDAKRRGSNSGYLPQVTASGGATYNHNSGGQQSMESSSLASSATSFGTNSSLHQYTAGVTLSQTLYDGGLTPGNVAQTGANYRAQVAALAVEKSLLSYDLKSAFAQLLYAQELVTLTSQIVDRRRSDANLIRLKYEGGRENKGAYLLAESDYKKAVLDLHNAERNVLVSEHQLAQIMGIKRVHPIVASGELVTRMASASPDFDKLATETPTHFQQVSNTEAARAGITIARSGFLPSVTTNVSADRDYPDTSSWSTGITVSVPIFDGGKSYFNVKAADASLRQSLANLQSSDDLSVYTLVQTHSTLLGDIEAVSVNQATVDAQNVRSEIGKGQYSDGLISFTDFNLIENDLVTAQKQQLQSRRDAMIAEANWEYAQGKGAIP